MALSRAWQAAALTNRGDDAGQNDTALCPVIAFASIALGMIDTKDCANAAAPSQDGTTSSAPAVIPVFAVAVLGIIAIGIWTQTSRIGEEWLGNTKPGSSYKQASGGRALKTNYCRASLPELLGENVKPQTPSSSFVPNQALVCCLPFDRRASLPHPASV